VSAENAERPSREFGGIATCDDDVDLVHDYLCDRIK